MFPYLADLRAELAAWLDLIRPRGPPMPHGREVRSDTEQTR
jgi:hypothetical protein